MDPKNLDDLAQKIAGAMPQGLTELQNDLEKNLRAGLESTLSKLNLVSREEFEVQQAVLARTREKLEHLQKEITDLEEKLLKSGNSKA